MKCKGKGKTSPKKEGGIAKITAYLKALEDKLTALKCDYCLTLYKPLTTTKTTRFLATCDATKYPAKQQRCEITYSYLAQTGYTQNRCLKEYTAQMKSYKATTATMSTILGCQNE